jgi:tetratricopeptide (TPR) repeat protein
MQKIYILIIIQSIFFKFCICQNNLNENILDSNTLHFIESFKKEKELSPNDIIGIGYLDVYMGNNVRGNQIMEYGLKQISNPSYEIYHEISVQNTKNGNYHQAIKYLNLAAKLNTEVYGYYGWLMLYYYRDYSKSISYLEKYDSLTPNFTDYPSGENINYLKGLVLLNQKNYLTSIKYFNKSIIEIKKTVGKKWIDPSVYYYLGIANYSIGDVVNAKLSFKKAIKYYPQFSEAYFYLAKIEKTNKNKLKKLNKAKQLLNNGFSKKDVYVEIFNPIYLQDIENEIQKININESY